MFELEVRRLDAPYGAEVRGVDPREGLDAAAAASLRQVFYEHGLLIFPDMDFSMPEQQALVEVLVSGEPRRPQTDGATSPSGDFVSNREPGATSATGKLLHHTDGMWSPEPFDLVSLWAAEVAAGAAPTTFAGMASAWDTLPEDLRARVDGLHVVHGEGPSVHAGESDIADNPNSGHRTVTTPIVRPHPVTGRTLLYVSEQQSYEVVELPGSEGKELLEALFAHLYSGENLIEHVWHDGDFAAWDNFAVQHGRPTVSYDSPTRTLRRAVVPLGSEWAKRWYTSSTAA
jgi:alpha-ketoglutarate-dependent taurine dioxygenase